MAGAPRPPAKLSLGEFLAALSERWQGLSREVLVAVPVAHAERLPVRDRQAFLEIFPDAWPRANTTGPTAHPNMPTATATSKATRATTAAPASTAPAV